MSKKITISTKITAVVLALVALTIVTISYLSYSLSQNSIQENYSGNLTLAANGSADKVQSYFNNVSANIRYIQQAQTIVEGAAPASTTGPVEPDTSSFDMMDTGMGNDPFGSDDEPSSEGFFISGNDDTGFGAGPSPGPLYDVEGFLNKIKNNYGYKQVMITDQNGAISYSTDPSKAAGANIIDPDGQTFSEGIRDLYFSNVVPQTDSTATMYAAAPVPHASSTSIVVIEIDMADIHNMVNDTTALGNTGEIILARADSSNNRIHYLNYLRNDPDAPLKIYDFDKVESEAVVNALRAGSGTGIGEDYKGEEVLAAWTYVPEVKWGVITKINTEEIFANSQSLFTKFLVAGIILLALSFLVSILFSKYLSLPIESLKNTLDLVGRGVLPTRVEKKTNDEIGQMAENLNSLVQTLKNTANFAQQIGEGNFDADFRPISNDDALGMALVDMRDNLIEGEKRDKERNWIVTGVAEVGEILRATDNLEQLGDEVIKYIISKINAVQGAFYVLDDENDGGDSYMAMRSSFAYNRKKHLKAKFKFAEGLVGQSAAEMDTVLRTEIPDDYVSITSGILGDKKPKALLIVPLITDEKVYGVLEFAGFEKFDSGQVKFVEELSLILARTVFNIKVNERTRRLLEESQAMSSELQEKQEILRQNAEEMQATQEELQKSNQKLEEQIEEVNRTQKRMQLLLENASEVITIYEEDSSVRYISPSVEPILGYTQNEMIGRSDVAKVHPDMRTEFEQMFKTLLANPHEQITIQYEYKTKEGNYIWIESTGTNLMDNPAIHGLIVNSRDITERRLAEQEQRMRSKMQSLSENSPDLITRIEQESISYINPVIEQYTGKKPVDFLNQNVRQAELNGHVLERWLEIVEEVNKSNHKVSDEMDFPSEMGNRVMQVNAIPEFDESNDLESVLVVSHDITDRKLIEREIQNKNKKIADSINYAKRIQNAILPNTIVINRVLPESFILYKPKDVVSGDFPWYVKTGDDIYMAAVDCTGHGVPGALLSLIGYFLLNDIVKSRKISTPGMILDQLDEGVTTTLRQDQDDSKTKDGMDIALCKINMKERKVDYAGAHRPLYVVQDGEMVEIKGNKFAIGGGIYKNQTNFANTAVNLSKGDSIYFCSDGFPDQFGGPDNRKFGPKRTRSLITEIHKKSMKEQFAIFDKEWENWKAEEKQTDDVLLIGIKF